MEDFAAGAAGADDLEAGILASMLPAPSTFALLHDVPKACSELLAARRDRRRRDYDAGVAELDDNGAEEEDAEADLLVQAIDEGLDFLDGVPPANLDEQVHGDLLCLVVEALEDPPTRARLLAQRVISLEALEGWLEPEPGLPASTWVAKCALAALRVLMLEQDPLESDAKLRAALEHRLATLPHARLRDTDARSVMELASNLYSVAARRAVVEAAALRFATSGILKRQLEAIELIVDLQLGPAWARDKGIVQALLGKAPVHAQVSEQFTQTLLDMGRCDMLSHQDLRAVWNALGGLFARLAGVLSRPEDISWILDEAERNPRHPNVVDVVHILTIRDDLALELATRCIDVLYAVADPQVLVLSLCTGSDAEQRLDLIHATAQQCTADLVARADFVPHAILAGFWRSLPPQFKPLLPDFAELGEPWLASVSAAFAADGDDCRFERGLDLGQLVLLEVDPATQKDLVLAVWDRATAHMLTPKGSRAKEDCFFRWLAALCARRMLAQETSKALFSSRVVVFLSSTAFGLCRMTHLALLRHLFAIVNAEHLESLIEPPPDAPSDSDSDDEETSPTFAEPLAYSVARCLPRRLEGVDLLWSLAINTADDEVAGKAIDTLQGLYNPDLDAPNPAPELRERKQAYVDKCTAVLGDAVSQQASGNTAAPRRANGPLRCLSFIQAMLDEADTQGTRGFRAHGARQHGSIHTLMAFEEEQADRPAGYGAVVEMRFYGNATVWDVRCCLLARTQHAHLPADRILLQRVRDNATPAPIGAEDNSTTLSELGFAAEETLLFSVSHVVDVIESTPRIRLLDSEGRALRPIARRAFEDVFEEWASHSLPMPGSREVVQVMRGEDFQRLFEFCLGGQTNRDKCERRVRAIFAKWSSVASEEDGEPFLTENDFCSFYEEAAMSRPTSAWKDLLRLGFDSRLRRDHEHARRITSEFRLSLLEREESEARSLSPNADASTPVAGESWRKLLASSAGLYDHLFALLALPSDDETMSRAQAQAWSVLMRLPTSRWLLRDLRALEYGGKALLARTLSPERSGCHLVLYTLQAVVSFMEEDEERRILLECPPEAGRIETHLRHVRRVSFQVPRRESRQGTDGAGAASWTKRFLAAGGLERVIGLLDAETEAHGILRQVSHTAVRACRLGLMYSKLQGHRPLSELGDDDLVRMVVGLHSVLQGLFKDKRSTPESTEDALWAFDSVYAWLAQREMPSGCIKAIDLAQCGAAEPDELLHDGLVPEEEAALRESLAEKIVRVGQRSSSVRDLYLSQLVALQAEGPLAPWLMKLLCELLVLPPPSRYLPRQTGDWDEQLLAGLSRAVVAGDMSVCKALDAMARAAPETMRELATRSNGLDDLVTHISRKLRSQGCAFKGDMLALLSTMCVAKPARAKQLAEAALLPLLRSKVPGRLRGSPEDTPRRRKGRVGLVNLGNTCYANSVLQLLVNVPSVASLVLGAKPPENETQAKVLEELQRAMAFLLESGRESYNARSLVEALGLDPSQQQDCEEFFIRIMDCVEAGTDSEAWEAAFGGSFEARQTCTRCNATSSRAEQVGTHLALDVQDLDSIADALERTAVQSETLEGFTCQSCGESGGVRLERSWREPPRELIVQLKRFEYDVGDQRKFKIKRVVRVEECVLGRELAGVVCHQGSADMGHYYTYVRDLRRGTWWEMNDRFARPIDGLPAEAFSSAYLLCYTAPAPESSAGAAPCAPQSLRAEVSVDNDALEASLTLRDKSFWSLCLRVMDTMATRGSTATAATLSRAQVRRRSSIGAGPERLEPLWWPSSSSCRDSRNSMGPMGASEPFVGQETLQNLCVAVLRVLSCTHVLDNDPYAIDPAVLAGLGNVLVQLCSADATVLLMLMHELQGLAETAQFSPRAFAITRALFGTVRDAANQAIVGKVLLSGGTFLHACADAFRRGDDATREDITHSLLALTSFGSDGDSQGHEEQDEDDDDDDDDDGGDGNDDDDDDDDDSFTKCEAGSSAPGALLSREVGDVLAENEPLLANLLAERATNPAKLDATAVQLAHASPRCTRAVTRCLADLVVVDGWDGAARNAFAAVLSKERLWRTAVAAIVAHPVVPFLPEVLPLVSRRSAQECADVQLITVACGHGSHVGLCINESLDRVAVLPGVGMTPVADQDAALEDGVLPQPAVSALASSKEFAELVVDPGESAVLWATESVAEDSPHIDWDACTVRIQPVPARQRRDGPLEAHLADAMGDVAGDALSESSAQEDEENQMQRAQQESQLGGAPTQRGKKKNAPAQWSRQIEILSSMGFSDEGKMRAALELAKGDESLAVEMLIADSLAPC